MNQPGDLVNFYSSFAPFLQSYIDRNPGIVLCVREPSQEDKDQSNFDIKGSVTVMWSDGSITSEHSSYVISANNKESHYETDGPTP